MATKRRWCSEDDGTDEEGWGSAPATDGAPDGTPVSSLGLVGAESDSESEESDGEDGGYDSEDAQEAEMDDVTEVVDEALSEVLRDQAAEAAAARAARIPGGAWAAATNAGAVGREQVDALAGVFATGHAVETNSTTGVQPITLEAEALLAVCRARDGLAAHAQEMGVHGLPEKLESWACCGSCCIAELYATQGPELVQITARAKELRERERTRPQEAIDRGTLFVRLHKKARTGRRGDATKRGIATNRLPKAKRRRERVLAADKYGWFRETRRRERRAYVQAVGRQLLMGAVCIVGICRLLHCSLTYLYEHAANEVDEAEGICGWVRRRRHGSRTGLPAVGELRQERCCALGCLSLMSEPFLEDQISRWKAAKTWRQQTDVLITFVYDSTTGRVTDRCAKSAYVHLGVSKYKWNRIKEIARASQAEQDELRRHGLQGSVPCNKMPEHLRRLILQEFDMATLSRPDDNSIRPNSADIKGLPGLIKHIRQRRPELLDVPATTVRDKIVGWLKENKKQLLAWAADHNVCKVCLENNSEEMLASGSFKQSRYSLEEADPNDYLLSVIDKDGLSVRPGSGSDPIPEEEAATSEIATLRQAVRTRADRLRDLRQRQEQHIQNDLDMRDLVLAFLTALEKCMVNAIELKERGLCVVTLFMSYVDDKTAYNLYSMAQDCRAGLERYIINLNGQVNAETGRMQSYICPAWAGSKTSSIINNELFVNAVSQLRESDLLTIRVMDGGPLNKAQAVSTHFSQLTVDTCMVAVSLFIFLWALHGKNDADAEFGLQQMLFEMLALIVGEDDLLRMCSSLPQDEKDPAKRSGGLVMDPRAFMEMEAHSKGRYNDLAGLSFIDPHIIGCCNHALLKKLLDGVGKVNLGLPGRWAGLTLGDLLQKFIATEDGYCRVMHKPDSTPIDLPVWKPSPTYVPLGNRSQEGLNRGFTANTVKSLGYNCCELRREAKFLAVMRTQSQLIGDGKDLDAKAKMTWPGGASYSPHTDPHAIRRRNTVAMAAENCAVHPPEAMVNALNGKRPDSIDPENHVVHMPGESTDAFPAAEVGSLCKEAVEKFNAANADQSKPAFMSDLFGMVVKEATRKRIGTTRTLEQTLHKPMSRVEAKRVREMLAQLKTARLPGTSITAPRPVPSLYQLFVQEESCKLALAEPNLPLTAARGQDSVRRRVERMWHDKYKDNMGAQTADLATLQQKHALLVKQQEKLVEKYRHDIQAVNQARQAAAQNGSRPAAPVRPAAAPPISASH